MELNGGHYTIAACIPLISKECNIYFYETSHQVSNLLNGFYRNKQSRETFQNVSVSLNLCIKYGYIAERELASILVMSA